MERLKTAGIATPPDQRLLSTGTNVIPRLRITNSLWVVLVCLAGYAWWMLPVSTRSNTSIELSQSEFTWSKITPSTSLQYHDCFDGFQCARLEVPMDYHRSDGLGQRFAIAITRLPAKVPVTDPRYGGAVLVNPGGPGGSGVAEVLIDGRNLQATMDAEADPSLEPLGDSVRDKYYDVIGFDPRGVNNTTPGFSCFPNIFAQRNWELQVAAEGMLGSADGAFRRNWERSVALNMGCSINLSTPFEDGEEALGEHMNTLPVARDMLEIIERHGEWRENQSIEALRRQDRINGNDQHQEIVAQTKWKRGREKLLYWGRSYGTVLGATFATLFPDRVERAVLDAVVDADKYYFDDGLSAIEDADAIFDRFAQYCDTVGPEQCPFYISGGAPAIKQAYLDLEDALYNASLPVIASPTRGPELVTWSDLKNILRLAMYQPIQGFPPLAQFASELARGDGSGVADMKSSARAPSCPSDQCVQAGPWSAVCQVPGQNEAYASSAVLCTDAVYLQNTDEEDFHRYWKALQEDSSMIADYWASLRMGCVGWDISPKWQLKEPVGGNTSHPLLFVNNILDPVTPLRSAQKMSQRFPGSVVLQQDSEGHSTLAAPSLCVDQAIRKYFQTGELPLTVTVCEADLKPMIGIPTVKRGIRSRSQSDQKPYEMLKAKSRGLPWTRLPL
ncbi:hypothetical protein ASPACDRAFT_127954 [Aspergillus aculeatus ATCC 16872]|uniref:Peptidase S33 tripeptidyl aminopeptidase-like C-terminal domain-containing protein n=1 Tax=Aspergillus aculeatus (strain ATCC 16872 / CBS 172.66 / WB 5094) TaxID=690307 RepID=A0A1L9WF45_ASPA1|nr:uncharacterized protein ASPACDRAFT_127954 [Aspergillus aculeatus ATCC 16872]OJJ94791.1 hypothetical protein ASPACDRAFT_127954 [Aspergillus aculeatus ATCC 16872]